MYVDLLARAMWAEANDMAPEVFDTIPVYLQNTYRARARVVIQFMEEYLGVD